MNKLIYMSADLPDELMVALDGHISTFFDSSRQVKSASSSAFSRELMEKHLPDDNHFAVHYIALGEQERYGPNRNGDGWPRAGLIHDSGNYGTHTFVKNGHYFREHRNRDPKKAIGNIVAAAFNEKMGRGEVVVHGDKRKAEREYEAAKRGEQLDCSMSARVPGDRCSICDHFAKSARVYCDHLKHHMTKWMPKHQKFAFAINDEPNFFDLSAVEHKADRIASHLEVRLPENEKSASYAGFQFSEDRATEAGVLLPSSLELGCSDPVHQLWLEKCAKAEASQDQIDIDFVKEAKAYAFSEPVTESQLTAMRELTPDVLFAWMAKRAATIPFNAFVAYVSNKSLADVEADENYKQAAARLGELFKFTSASVANPETENMVTPAIDVKLANFGPNFNDEKELKVLAGNNTLVLADARQRMYENCVQSKRASQNVNTIQTELSQQARNWLQAYGLYKVAAVRAIDSQDNVDASTLLLLTSQSPT